MSLLYCSLCLKPTNEYKPLANDEGDFKDIYETTIKYFDPILLTTEEKANKYPQKNQVFCQSCWKPNKDFTEIQDNVRTLSPFNTILVKVECDDQDDVKINHKNGHDNYNGDADGENYAYSYENVYVKPDLDLEADYEEKQSTNDEDDDEEDDEDDKPLIYLKKNTINKSKIVPREKLEKIITIEESRKRKQIISGVRAELINIDTDKDHAQKKNVQLNDDSDEKIKRKPLLNLEKPKKSDMFIKQWKSVLECDLCKETSSSFDELRSHFEGKHKTRFYIKCCARTYYRRWDLVHHIQRHLNPVTNKCNICGKVFSRKFLKKHKKMMHGKIEKFECKFCYKEFNFRSYLNRHLLTHFTGGKRDIVCKECGIKFARTAKLKIHIERNHRNCDQCGKNVGNIYALKKHLLEHHALIEKITFACDICGVKLDSPVSLNNHMTVYHNDDLTIYICSICGKVKTSAKAVLDHKKWVHDKERKCSYCDKTFKHCTALSEHIATHTGQDLYQCSHCPETFKARSRMSLHCKKVHPVEWKEGKKYHLPVPKVDIEHAKYEIVV